MLISVCVPVAVNLNLSLIPPFIFPVIPVQFAAVLTLSQLPFQLPPSNIHWKSRVILVHSLAFHEHVPIADVYVPGKLTCPFAKYPISNSMTSPETISRSPFLKNLGFPDVTVVSS